MNPNSIVERDRQSRTRAKQYYSLPATISLASALLLAASGCSSDGDGPESTPSVTEFRPHHAQTLRLGTIDNVEVVKFIPGRQLAIAVASKTRRILLVNVSEEGIEERRTATLFAEDTSESELTHIDISSDGSWAVLTRTFIEKDSSDATTGCSGSLVFVDATDSDRFGNVLAEVPVGPMPDSVDISPDDRWVVSANERDVVWGKCETVADLEAGSLSIIDVSGGPNAAVEAKRITMSNLEREPESVVFGADSDLIVATLQDTHEVLFTRRSDVLNVENPTEEIGTIHKLATNTIEQEAWPDGVVGFVADDGREFFAIAGEANDTVTILDAEANAVKTIEVLSSMIPADFPRDGSWGPLFRPDSVASMVLNDKSYLVVSLKASGAVAIWDVGRPNEPLLVVVEKVGDDDTATATEESTLGTEGISASSPFGWILCANEVESSLSLLAP